jgi:hypothetical protein
LFVDGHAEEWSFVNTAHGEAAAIAIALDEHVIEFEQRVRLSRSRHRGKDHFVEARYGRLVHASGV